MVAISKQSQGGGTFLCQKDFCAISFLFSHVGVYYFAKNVKKNNVKKKSFTIGKVWKSLPLQKDIEQVSNDLESLVALL